MSQTTEKTTQDQVPRRNRRLVFVDLLRLLASFQMLHGHTLDALLSDEVRQGPIHAVWNWQRGLVSVGFLFAAGIAFSLSTLVDVDRYLAKKDRVAKRWRRVSWLIILGYLMHFPAEWIAGQLGSGVSPEAAQRSLEMFAMADVLQCIGASIGILMIVTHLTKNARVVAGFAAIGAVLIFALAPLADAVVPEGAIRPFANYLSHRGGSLFPLFPWTGFVFAGVAVTFVVAPRGAQTNPKVPVPRLAALAVALFVVAFVAEHVSFTLVDESTTYQAIPSFAIVKLAAVVAIVTVLSVIALKVKFLPNWMNTLAGESLMLYWFHLNLLYGAGVGLKYQIGRTLSLPAALGVAAMVVVVSVTVGMLWHRFKKRRDAFFRGRRERREAELRAVAAE